MDTEKIDTMWDILRALDIENQTLQVVTAINGYSAETLKEVLYAVTGYRDFDQVAGDPELMSLSEDLTDLIESL